MTLLAPGWLWLLAVVAGLAAAYVVLQRRRRHYAVRFTNLDLLASVAPKRPGWRRHVPAAAIALALGVLVVAAARPARDERVASEEATVMLVLDVSASMRATDVSPSRMEAAVEAASDFVDDLPERLRVGLVAFDTSARVVATPTVDHDAVADGLARLRPGTGTAAGEGIITALDLLTGSGEAGAIVLLSDGVTTVGRSVADAVAAAREQSVPVTTIAFGTDDGTVEVAGRIIPVPADPVTMEAVADATGGQFFTAATGDQLRSVYEDIGTRIAYTVEQREIGTVFGVAALVLLLAALAASLVWTGRIL